MRLLKIVGHVLVTILMGSVVVLSSSSSALAFDYDPPAAHWDTYSVGYDDGALNSTWRWEIWEAKYTWSAAGSNFYFYQSTGISDNDLYLGATQDPDAAAETLTAYNPSTKHINYCDTVFNQNLDWNVGSDIDIETVALHEFGHWLHLNDLYYFWNTTKVMYGAYTGLKTQLAQDDINGIIYIYGES